MKTKMNNTNSKCQKKKSIKIKRTSQLHKHTDWTVCTRFVLCCIPFSLSFSLLVFLPRKRSGFLTHSIVRNDWFAYLLLHLALFLSILFLRILFYSERNPSSRTMSISWKCCMCVFFQTHCRNIDLILAARTRKTMLTRCGLLKCEPSP